MSQIPHIPVPFANSGDKNEIPITTSTEGRMSWDKGLDSSHTVAFKDGGKVINRKDLNTILNIISSHLVNMQNGGGYIWNNTTNYSVGSHIRGSDGSLYKAKSNNGPSTVISDPTTSVEYWSKIPTLEEIIAVTGIDISTVEDIVTGTNNEKLITPLGLAGAISQIAPTDEDLTNLQDTLQADIDTRATIVQMQEAIAALVDSSPEALNTLNELATALGNDPNFATTISTQIGTIDNKVTTAQNTADGKWTATDASTTVSGIVTLATVSDISTGTNSTKAVTPEALALSLPTIVSGMIPAAKIASPTVLGNVKIGEHLTVTEDGTISINQSNTSELGVVQLYNNIDSTSASTAATANAAKLAYDKGQEGLTKVNTLESTMDTMSEDINNKWTAVDATTEVKGISSIATVEEITTGTDSSKIVTPAALASALPNIVSGIIPAVSIATKISTGVVQVGDNIDITEVGVISVPSATTSGFGVVQLYDNIDSTDTSVAATANAVKLAYDRGSLGITNAETAQTTANNKWTAVDATTEVKGIVQLNDSIDDTSTSTAATANAVKLAYDRGSSALTATDTKMTSFVLEDGDGVEVVVDNAKEIKLSEGGGIDVTWTDTSTGDNTTPYNLTLKLSDTINPNTGVVTNGYVSCNEIILNGYSITIINS